jgi:hypothetical protein
VVLVDDVIHHGRTARAAWTRWMVRQAAIRHWRCSSTAASERRSADYVGKACRPPTPSNQVLSPRKTGSTRRSCCRRRGCGARLGTVAFVGAAPGADVVGEGEVVFNTAMTGYQEVLTDPSYAVARWFA